MRFTGNIKAMVSGLILASVLLASCVKSQTVQDGEPREIVMNRLQTKADYPADGVFGIYAYHIPVPSGSPRLDSWNSDDATAYLQNVAFMYNGIEAAGYDTSSDTHRPYYWPLSGSLVFAGYSPHVDESSAVTSVSFADNLTVGRPENPHIIIDFTQNADPEEMVDLLYFTMMQNSVSKEDSPVPIAFSHAMSKVSFSFKDPKGYYRIRNVRLKDCINQGRFYAAVESSGWSPMLSGLSDYMLQEEITQLSGTETKMPEVLPIPQFLDGFYSTLGAGTGKGVSLVFDIVDNTDEHFHTEIHMKLFPYEDGDGNVVNENLPSRWQMGMHYTYIFTIEADPIEFDSPSVTVEAYEEDTPDTI